jgi:plasmid stabilization system protein ParE
MILRWDRRAIQDLREIGGYIAAHGSPAAAYLGIGSVHPHIRILNPIRYPYRIYYTVQGNEVVILHIRHTSHQAPDDLPS